jgi:hypothetical protein
MTLTGEMRRGISALHPQEPKRQRATSRAAAKRRTAAKRAQHVIDMVAHRRPVARPGIPRAARPIGQRLFHRAARAPMVKDHDRRLKPGAGGHRITLMSPRNPIIPNDSSGFPG